MQTENVSMQLPEDTGIPGANRPFFEKSKIYFQKLCREYSHSANIKNRATMGLQHQHFPKSYWKYLSEKSPFA